MTKLAVVLFNLGGPDSLKAVKPFLFNLFRDEAIISLPAAARYPLAAMIATTRAKTGYAACAHTSAASAAQKNTRATIKASPPGRQ